MKKTLCAAVLVSMLPIGSAMADKDVGCGAGTLIMKGQKGLVFKVLAATTNGSFGNQTFGITTGTSNCTDTGGGAASAKAFVETNRVAIAKDISRGNGETVANLATVAGCRDASSVGLTLQKNFKTIFPDASASDRAVSESVVKVLESDAALTLGDAQGQVRTVLKSQIDEQRTLELSLMPEGLEKTLTDREFVDLIAFLADQK